jgi:hypothetical protein
MHHEPIDSVKLHRPTEHMLAIAVGGWGKLRFGICPVQRPRYGLQRLPAPLCSKRIGTPNMEAGCAAVG